MCVGECTTTISMFYPKFAMNLNQNFVSDCDTKLIVRMALTMAISDYDSLCCYKNESCNFSNLNISLQKPTRKANDLKIHSKSTKTLT